MSVGLRASPVGRIAAGVVALLFVIVAMAGIGAAGLPSPIQAACGPRAPERVGEVRGVPPQGREFAALYVEAAGEYRLGERGPAILAAIHEVESGFGANQGPSSAGAEGHMQFLASTWQVYGVDADGDGRADPASAEDAIHSAARYLAALGAPEDWYGAIFGYNHADWYVQDVLAGAKRLGDAGEIVDATTLTCEGPMLAGGPAELGEAVRVYEPARDQRVPDRYIVSGFEPVVIDARIWPNVRWMLESYDLALTAGKETGHASHGDGSAIDAVPATNIGSVAHWRETVERLATDLGWSRGCASAGVRPSCELVPAIEFIGYNGYDASHGDPEHSRIAHIHVSWVSETQGTPQLTRPEWLLVFPSPAAEEAGTGDQLLASMLAEGDRRRAPLRTARTRSSGVPAATSTRARARRTFSTRLMARRGRAFFVSQVNDPGMPGTGGRT